MVEVRVFRPKTLGGLLRLYARNPEALLFAGGTSLIPRLRGENGLCLQLPAKVIYLGNVAELSRISRTQRYLDIGATLSLARIMSVGRNVLPQVLHSALGAVAYPSVRNLATLGGNLCRPEGGGDTLPALRAVRAQVELRSLGSTRWVSVDRFVDAAGEGLLREGELACRVRVPLEEWDFQVYRKVGQPHPAGRTCLSFAAVARLPKGTLEALHCSFGGLGPGALPGREIEARLKNVRLPLEPKRSEAILEELRRRLQQRRAAGPEGGPAEAAGPEDGPAEAAAGRAGEHRAATALRLFRWFLLRLSEKSLQTL